MGLNSIFGFFTPAVCAVCGEPLVEGETLLCGVCRASIGQLRFHTMGLDNPLRERIAPRSAPIARVVACTDYTRHSVAGRLIRRAKFDNRPDLIRQFAAMFADELRRDGVPDDIDVLQPVPMRFMRRLTRGFNQADDIAKVWSRSWGVPVINAMRATRRHGAQARTSGAAERLANVAGSFRVVRPELIEGRHVAIIDDILTTGATASAAVAALLSASPRAITIITLAATVLRK